MSGYKVFLIINQNIVETPSCFLFKTHHFENLTNTPIFAIMTD